MINDTQIEHILNKTISEINEHKFYDAHETLELIWYPRRFESSNEVKLIKGLINATVSLELLKKGKKDASKKVWKIYLKYRPLLYKTASAHLNSYHKIARHVESIKNKYGI